MVRTSKIGHFWLINGLYLLGCHTKYIIKRFSCGNFELDYRKPLCILCGIKMFF